MVVVAGSPTSSAGRAPVPSGADLGAPSVEEVRSPEDRALDALEECVLRWGLAKTTVDDVARAAGISRATLYRLFPGGKAAMFQAGTRRMVTQLAGAVATDVAESTDLGDALTRAIVSARRFLSGDEALQLVLEHDPASIKAQLALGGFDQVLDAAAGAMGPALAPFAGSAERGAAASVWAARQIVSHLVDSSGDDLGDPAVAGALVHGFFLPGFDRPERSGEQISNQTTGHIQTTDHNQTTDQTTDHIQTTDQTASPSHQEDHP